MRANILTDWEQLAALEPDWNKLLKISRSNTIFLTWEWIQAWHDVVGDRVRPVVITVRDERHRLVGIAPFYQYRLKLFDKLPFMGLRTLADYATASEYPDWFVDPNCEQEALVSIARTLKQNKRLWDVIWMPRMSGWSGAFERVTQALKAEGLLYQSRQSPFSSFALPDSPQAFEAGFSSKRRQQLRRNRRNLMAKPGVDLILCENQNQLPQFLDSLFELHHRRRMLLDDPGCFIRKPAEAAFYRAFLPKSLDNGWLRLAAITQDGNIEAIQIGYAYNGEFLQMQEGFNPDYTSGAGNVLRHCVIENSINEGLVNYDFLGGFSEHKRRWGAQERFGYDLMIGRPSLKTQILFRKEIWPSGRYITEYGLIDGNS